MSALLGTHLFLLGLASGLTVLTLTAYRRVSPNWLKGLLIVTGLFMMSRYLTMALFTSPEAPQRFWTLRYCWFASLIGLTLPSVVVIDQLVKHPAMSPKKLLVWLSPFLAIWAAVILFGHIIPRSDPLLGWTVHLSTGWQWVASGAHTVFIVGFLIICVMIMLKFPSRPIRIALLGLTVGFGYLGVNGLLFALGDSSVGQSLYPEMVTLLAIWNAYETADTLQHTS